MRLSSQNNQFIFNLPTDFIEDYLYEEFERMMVKNFVPYDTALDYINSTIKEIIVPGMQFETAQQTIKRSKKIYWKEAGNIADKFTSDFEITFRSVDSWINYYMLQQIATEFYLNPNKHTIPFLSVQILDKDGTLLYTLLIRDSIIQNISEIALGYQKTEVEEETFTMRFKYNWISIYWELDDEDKKTSTSIFDIPINYKPGELDLMTGNVPYDTFEREAKFHF